MSLLFLNSSRVLLWAKELPKWIFVPLLLDCVTARYWWSFIQNSTERKNKTKIPDWFANYMRRLHSSLTSCVGFERICSTFDFLWFRVYDKFFWNKEVKQRSVFILTYFITILQIIQFDFTILRRKKVVSS